MVALRLRFATVRLRTTLLATAVTAVVLVAASLALLTVLSSQLTTSRDDVDRAHLRDLLGTARSGTLPQVLPNVDDNSVAQVITAQGQVLAATSNIRGRPPIVPAEQAATGTPHEATVRGPDDRETERYRLWIGAGPSPNGPLTVVTGRSLETVGDATRTLRDALLVGVPLVLVLLAGAVWWVVGRALGRVDALTTTVAGLGPRDLDHRVPETGVDDEIGRLATTMNQMLQRLAEAADRQAAFVADASHDLQSPLTALRTQLEIALAHPGVTDPAYLAGQLLVTTDRMEQLVAELLTLARLDEDRPPVRELLDLDELVLEEIARFRPGSRVAWVSTGVSAAPVTGDPGELRRLVRNLLDNAARHAATRVEVTVRTDLDGVDLTVCDDGPGVSAHQCEAIFERFHRGDPARDLRDADAAPTSRPGSGLGLAIARRIAERHHGTLVARPGPGGHFVLHLTEPSVTGATDRR